MKQFIYLQISFALFISIAQNAHAYVGPGPGITLLGSLWAVIAAVLLAVFSILLWPMRALLKKRKAAKLKNKESNSEDGQDS